MSVADFRRCSALSGSIFSSRSCAVSVLVFACCPPARAGSHNCVIVYGKANRATTSFIVHSLFTPHPHSCYRCPHQRDPATRQQELRAFIAKSRRERQTKQQKPTAAPAGLGDDNADSDDDDGISVWTAEGSLSPPPPESEETSARVCSQRASVIDGDSGDGDIGSSPDGLILGARRNLGLDIDEEEKAREGIGRGALDSAEESRREGKQQGDSEGDETRDGKSEVSSLSPETPWSRQKGQSAESLGKLSTLDATAGVAKLYEVRCVNRHVAPMNLYVELWQSLYLPRPSPPSKCVQTADFLFVLCLRLLSVFVECKAVLLILRLGSMLCVPVGRPQRDRV